MLRLASTIPNRDPDLDSDLELDLIPKLLMISKTLHQRGSNCATGDVTQTSRVGSVRTSRQSGVSAAVVSFSAENSTTNCRDVVSQSSGVTRVGDTRGGH